MTPATVTRMATDSPTDTQRQISVTLCDDAREFREVMRFGLEAGAARYVEKGAPPAEICAAIREAAV